MALSEITNHLSLWEIAHRWHGADPHSDATPPIEVQDWLREACLLIIDHEIHVSTAWGVEASNFRDRIPRHKFCADESNTEKSFHEQYADHVDSLVKRHNGLVDGLEVVFQKSEFPKEKLLKVHLSRHEIPVLCDLLDLELPAFWFSDSERASESNHRHLEKEPEQFEITGKLTKEQVEAFWEQITNSQRTRLICRHLAAKLWQKDPKLTIVDVAGSELLQEFGGASYYNGKNTVRDWISDLNPA